MIPSFRQVVHFIHRVRERLAGALEGRVKLRKFKSLRHLIESIISNSVNPRLTSRVLRLFRLVPILFLFSILAPVANSMEPTNSGVSSASGVHAQSSPRNGAGAQQPNHKRGELLIKYKQGVVRAEGNAAVSEYGVQKSVPYLMPSRLLKAPGLRQVPIQRWTHAYLKAGLDEEQALERIRKNPFVETAQLNYVYTVDQLPSDPGFSLLWGLHNTGQTGGTGDADIDAPEAWDITTGSGSVIVGVIDTGVDYTHPDLAANMWINTMEIAGNGIDDDSNGCVDDVYGCDFVNNDGNPLDDFGHGTHVAGTIAAVGNNGIGVAGVSWNAKIMALKFLGSNGSGYTSDAIEAILYATEMGARVLNNSWGGGSYDQALLDAINTAASAGVLFVASAGNNNQNTDSTPAYPASYTATNVLSVAATDNSDLRASFSNFGATSVDLGAPGVCIYSTFPVGSFAMSGGFTCNAAIGSSYGTISGTSMASPQVSGAAALLIAQNPSRDTVTLKNLLMWTADPVPSLREITVTGGRLNVNNALRCDPGALHVLITNPGAGFVAKLDPSGAQEIGNPLRAAVHTCEALAAGASVTASFSNGDPSITLWDDGAHGDGAPNDGMYGNTWYALREGQVTITVTASKSGLTTGSASLGGEVRGGDADNDGLTDLFESSIGTNPVMSDTDGDGLSDGVEVCYDGNCLAYNPYPSGGDMNPLVPDTDADGFSDGQDTKYGGNPVNTAKRPWGTFTALKFSAGGSYFKWSTLTIPMQPGPDGALYLGVIQPASGAHAGAPDGSESPGVDEPWMIFQTGMHLTPEQPVTIIDVQDNGNGTGTMHLNFSGWGVAWSYSAPYVNLGGGIHDCGTTTDGICLQLNGNDLSGIYNNGSGIATVICDTPNCAPGSHFTLDYSATSPQWAPYFAFPGVPYVLHMEGEIATAHPVIKFDNAGSYFSLWTPSNKVSLLPGPDGGLYLDVTQPAFGSHSGAPNGSESPGIDQPWMFFQTGMHQTTTTPVRMASVTDNGNGTASMTLDFSGWGVTWNGWSSIALGGGVQNCGNNHDGICTYPWQDIAGSFNNGTGIATGSCDTGNCGYGSIVSLNYFAKTPQGYPTLITGGLDYNLHLQGSLITSVSRAMQQ